METHCCTLHTHHSSGRRHEPPDLRPSRDRAPPHTPSPSRRRKHTRPTQEAQLENKCATAPPGRCSSNYIKPRAPYALPDASCYASPLRSPRGWRSCPESDLPRALRVPSIPRIPSVPAGAQRRPRAYPLSSYYQSGATSPPVYQPTEAPVESAKTLFQPVQYQAPILSTWRPNTNPLRLCTNRFSLSIKLLSLSTSQFNTKRVLKSASTSRQPSTNRPAQYQPAQPQYQPIESQYQSLDQYGQYTFGFAGGDLARSETRGADGSVRGSYSYVDEDGRTQTQHYVADELGFRVTGTNLPQVPAGGAAAPVHEPLPTPQPVRDTPEVAAAKAAFLKAYNEAAIAAAEAPDEASRALRTPAVELLRRLDSIPMKISARLCNLFIHKALHDDDIHSPDRSLRQQFKQTGSGNAIKKPGWK
ncbi:Cuticle protein 6 [Penaeus vannamei]|uniref:Cuticle protein 6 n=1 Tax=Penaeus vannamei TaxID=6689 RepID=A0A423T381_PENVA|nr:Cuticle protein 6 [Penaeus vannamei]